ncbi:CNPV046 ankyrin repeat protein [Canarypox virus]|uniref:CNPV046 ankyrin repeat protein n=1 Tax=Canarypox virus TaxID=44088 RepID=Q6VZV1_CNPV|nr:CNPV046 ankyrin repeat protein [Canarypox virus]AAR83392.1 CNPV046 ankyrin repeat protein [Canarypox virus]AWD84522.1 ankyrin repeat protein [Canarypox virus]
MLNRRYPLYFAIISQDITYTKWLLNNGYNVNRGYKNFIYRPLFYALTSRNKKLIKLLLDYGADVNNLSNYLPKTSVALYHALDDINITKILLDHGANVNLIDSDSGMSPLHEVVERDLYEVGKLLLSKGANINIQSSIAGYTPVHLAVKLGKLKMLKLLLEYGADINIRSAIYGYTALHLSVKLETDCIKITNCIILYNPNVNAVDYYEKTPLYYAILRKDIELIKLLIHNGADINFKNKIKRNILFSVLVTLDVDFIIYLLRLGGDVNAVDIFGETPFTALLQRRFILSFIIKVLVYHIVMLYYSNSGIEKHIGFKINMKKIDSVSILKSYKEKAENDISNMKKFRLSYRYTLLDLFKYGKTNIINRFYNHHAVNTLKNYFTIYYHFIRYEIQEAIEKNFLMNCMYELINSILSDNGNIYWFKLPVETRYMILSNIDNASMRYTLKKQI